MPETFDSQAYDWLLANGPAWPSAVAKALGVDEGTAHRRLLQLTQSRSLFVKTPAGFDAVRLVRHSGDNGALAGGI
jgi:hypothetical protein